MGRCRGCAGGLRSCTTRTADGIDHKLEKAGLDERNRSLFWHGMDQLKEQALAVLPIACFLIFVIGVFFQEAILDPGQTMYGLVCAIFGLLFFMEGLRIIIMPLGSVVGNRLPLKWPLPVVLLIAGCLGILVTYAEPAIASLAPLALLVDKAKAPYLYYALNDQREMLVLSIGLGVGLAAVVGTLRFVQGWPMKPIIYISLAPTIALACYMQWGNPDLAPLLGLAWDCGAITTGPVTVPILLAVGIGVMGSQRQKRIAKAALQNAVDTNTGQTLEGFGVVTLASVYPILAVEIMGICIAATKTTQEIIDSVDSTNTESAVDKSPTREIIFAIRAVAPLITFLLLICIFMIREPLPLLTVYTTRQGLEKRTEDTSRSMSMNGAESSRSLDADFSNTMPRSPTDPPAIEPLPEKQGKVGDGTAVPLDMDSMTLTVATNDEDPSVPATAQAAPAAAAAPIVSPFAAADDGNGHAHVKADGEKAAVTDDHSDTHTEGGHSDPGRSSIAELKAELEADEAKMRAQWAELAKLPWHKRYGGMIIGALYAQVGMIAFNIGLTYGFTSLGNQTGILLPAAYLTLPAFPESPYYDYVGGIILVLVVTFVLGFLATRAEPALRVLGRTVEALSNGAFTSSMLIYAVSIGVGTGMAVGSTKILFGVPLIYIILAKYAVACTITIFAKDDFCCVAWDSAGVTTGPVTVPFVLSLGIGFSTAVGATEGFGILTAASVAPIISVLTTDLMKKPAKALMRSMSSMSESFKKKRSQSFGARGGEAGSKVLTKKDINRLSHNARKHKDTNQAIDNVAVLVAAAARLERESVTLTAANRATAKAGHRGSTIMVGVE